MLRLVTDDSEEEEQQPERDFLEEVRDSISAAAQEWTPRWLDDDYKLALHDSSDDGSWFEICVRWKGHRDVAVYRVKFDIEKVNELGLPEKP